MQFNPGTLISASTIPSLYEIDLHKNSLREVIDADNDEGIKQVFSKEKLDVPLDNGCTPLQHAARHGKQKALETLILLGADVTLLNSKKQTILHIAAEYGQERVVEFLSRKYPALLNTQDETGATPLMHVIRKSCIRAAKTLLESGANPEITLYNGTSPMHVACIYSLDLVKLLSKYPALINIKNGAGDTPLHFSTKLEKEDLENDDIIHHLLNAGADPCVPNRNNETALSSALKGYLLKDDTISYLIEMAKEINTQDSEGYTPLFDAILTKRTNAVEKLLAKGADVSISAKDGSTPLHEAARTGCSDIVRILLKIQPTLLDVKDCEGKTPMHVASASVLTLLLLEYKADPFIRDSKGYTVMHHLVTRFDPDSAEAIKKLAEIFPKLLEEKDDEDNTPLFLAAGLKASTDKLPALFDLTKLHTNHKRQNPLHVAARKGCKENLLFFNTKNPSFLNEQDKMGETPLHIAALYNQKDIVTELIKLKAISNIVDKHGFTPAANARIGYNTEVYKLLTAHDSTSSADAKEFFYRKLIACAFELEGRSTLTTVTGEEKRSISLEGMSSKFVWNRIQKHIQNFINQNAAIKSDNAWILLLQMFKNAFKLNSDELVCLDKSKQPILLSSGYKKHAVAMVFWKHSWLTFDRGGLAPQTCILAGIMPGAFTPSFIDVLQVKLNKVGSDEYKEFINEVVKKGKAEDPITNALEEVLCLPKQISGNCTWASAEAAIYGFLALYHVTQAVEMTPEGITPEVVRKIALEQKKIFTDWLMFTKRFMLDKYKKRLDYKDLIYTPDKDLIATCEKLMSSKSK